MPTELPSRADPGPVGEPPGIARKPSWYRRLSLRVAGLSVTRHAFAAMLGVAAVEAAVFPVPPFALLIPMVLASPHRWAWLALCGALASVGGGVLGYGLGAFFGEVISGAVGVSLDRPVSSEWLGIDSTLGQLLGDEFWILALMASVLPTPFNVVAIGSGMVKVPLAKFLLAVLLGRGVRFFVVAGAMRFVGPPARRWLRA